MSTTKKSNKALSSYLDNNPSIYEKSKVFFFVIPYSLLYYFIRAETYAFWAFGSCPNTHATTTIATWNTTWVTARPSPSTTSRSDNKTI